MRKPSRVRAPERNWDKVGAKAGLASAIVAGVGLLLLVFQIYLQLQQASLPSPNRDTRLQVDPLTIWWSTVVLTIGLGVSAIVHISAVFLERRSRQKEILSRDANRVYMSRSERQTLLDEQAKANKNLLQCQNDLQESEEREVAYSTQIGLRDAEIERLKQLHSDNRQAFEGGEGDP